MAASGREGIRAMAEDAEEKPAAQPAKSGGGMMSKLVNGVGIFVLTLGAVIVGGNINSKMHPMPDMKMDKDGKITPIVEVHSGGGHGEHGEGAGSLYYAIDPPLVVNFEDGSAVRFLQIS